MRWKGPAIAAAHAAITVSVATPTAGRSAGAPAVAR